MNLEEKKEGPVIRYLVPIESDYNATALMRFIKEFLQLNVEQEQANEGTLKVRLFGQLDVMSLLAVAGQFGYQLRKYI